METFSETASAIATDRSGVAAPFQFQLCAGEPGGGLAAPAPAPVPPVDEGDDDEAF